MKKSYFLSLNIFILFFCNLTALAQPYPDPLANLENYLAIYKEKGELRITTNFSVLNEPLLRDEKGLFAHFIYSQAFACTHIEGTHIEGRCNK